MTLDMVKRRMTTGECEHGEFRDECGWCAATEQTEGLLAERDALKARVAELEAELAATMPCCGNCHTAQAVAAEREACATADDFNGNTADDLRAAIRARGAR